MGIVKHIDKIDFLRGVAILLVFLYHSQLCLFPDFSIYYSSNNLIDLKGLKSILLFILPVNYGWSGVSLFLLISGYLIHLGFLNNPKGFNVKEFYIKRFCRIYPPYIIVLFFIVITTSGFFYMFTKKGIIDIISHVLLVHNLSDSTYFSINPSFWSLAMEVQLYLIYPILLILRNKWGITRTFFIIFSFAILWLIVGLFLPGNIVKSISYYSSVFTNWFIWACGALIAENQLINKFIFNKNKLIIAISSYFLFLICKCCVYTDGVGYLFMLIGLIAFFEWSIYTSFKFNSYIFKIISLIGLCSYSIYLIHQSYLKKLFDFLSIIYINHAKLKMAFVPLIVLLAFVIIFFISYGFFILIEKKSSKLVKYIK